MKRMLLALLVVAVMMTAVLPASAEDGPVLFNAKRAVRISDTQVVVEFDKPLDPYGIDGCWTSLRWEYMTEDGKPGGLLWSESDFSEGGKIDQGDPLQKAMTGWTFWSDYDLTRIVLTFAAEDLDAYEETEGNQWYDWGARAYLVIEEKNPPADGVAYALDVVLSEDGSLLAGTVMHPGGYWDGCAIVIEKDYNYSMDGFGETKEFTFEETEDPETTAPETEAQGTQAPGATGDAGTEGEGTDKAPETEGGCGSVITFAPVALVLMMGAALVASKKR